MWHAPCFTPGMLDAVFHYRTLIGKCELGCGLELDEIEQVTALEQAFAPTDEIGVRARRRFRRAAVKLDGLVRGDHINDRIQIVELALGGLIVRNAPFVACGEQVEVVIDVGDHSYRFRAQGVWIKDDGDDYKVGLVFVGMPVCLHRVQVSAHEADLIDQIAAAA
jgi:hypothetical protein